MRAVLRSSLFLILGLLLSLPGGLLAQEQERERDKTLDVRSSAGDLHLGNDADLRAIGLPAYPGARERKNDEHRSNANLALFTSAFGFKLLVLNFDADDPPAKVLDFYRDKLKKYGHVLECRTTEHGGDIQVHDADDDSHHSKELRCEGDNSGPVVELKAGTADNQHAVAVEPAEKGSGATFAVVYVHARGKQGDI